MYVGWCYFEMRGVGVEMRYRGPLLSTPPFFFRMKGKGLFYLTGLSIG